MASNARKTISEHGAHRALLSPPGSARRVLSLTAGTASPDPAKGQDAKRFSARQKRTLSQPLVLSSDDSSDGGPERARLLLRRQGRTGAGAPPPQRSQPPQRGSSVKARKTADRDKYRRVLQEEDDEADATDSVGAAVREKQAAKQTRGNEAAPPSGSQKTSPDPLLSTSAQHRDVLRSRGTSVPVSRAPSALCYDVGGFLTIGPRALTSTTNLREYRGKVVLIGQKDLVHASRFSCAGASALIVAAKDPEEARTEYKCCKETRIPVVFVTDVGAMALEHGSLVKMLFDVASESPQERHKLSKNAHYRRVISGSQEKTSPSTQRSEAVTEISADSGTDSDKDAEYYLVRRRRQSGQTSRNQTPRIDHMLAQRAPISPVSRAVTYMVDEGETTSSKMSRRNGDPQAHANHGPLDLANGAVDRGQTARVLIGMVDDLMHGASSDILRKVDLLSDKGNTGVSPDQLAGALAARLNQELCSPELQKKRRAIFTMRELCRAKSDTIAPGVIRAVVHIPGALEVFWENLARPQTVQDEDSVALWLSLQVQSYWCALLDSLRGDSHSGLFLIADCSRRLPSPCSFGAEECRASAPVV